MEHMGLMEQEVSALSEYTVYRAFIQQHSVKSLPKCCVQLDNMSMNGNTVSPLVMVLLSFSHVLFTAYAMNDCSCCGDREERIHCYYSMSKFVETPPALHYLRWWC